MEESLQIELKDISVVVDIIDAIESARVKREEIRKDLESYGYDYETYGMPNLM